MPIDTEPWRPPCGGVSLRMAELHHPHLVGPHSVGRTWYRTICSCGWHSPYQDDRLAAASDAAAHWQTPKEGTR